MALLIKKGADINATNKRGGTPLHSAAFWGYIEIAKLLIEKGANVNAKGYNSKTPLHNAAQEGHIKIANFFIQKGVDINAKNNRAQTPWDMARSKEMKKLLIKRLGRRAEGNNILSP